MSSRKVPALQNSDWLAAVLLHELHSTAWTCVRWALQPRRLPTGQPLPSMLDRCPRASLSLQRCRPPAAFHSGCYCRRKAVTFVCASRSSCFLPCVQTHERA